MNLKTVLSLDRKTNVVIVLTLVIGGSFYLGAIFYPTYVARDTGEISFISLKEFRPELEKIIQEDLKITAGEKTMTIKSIELKSWVEPYIRDYSGIQDLRVSYPKIAGYLESFAPHLNIEPVNAKFSLRDGRAEVFVPSVQGKRLNILTTSALLASKMMGNSHSPISLVFEMIEPEITLEKINDLGIQTLLGKGESDYGKSSSARIHNIKIGMSKFNGIILKPGEEFSFNKILGEIDEKDGYLAELVIKNGELVREYGGGLCQVATTVFRSAILAGLDIIERKPHSFPVQYYNPQGFDATIYPGIVDLKFTNNTKSHILIQTRLVGSKLLVEVYGSNTGKKITLEGPFQYDKQPSGAMKAYFIRKIYRDGNIEKEERFDSTYKPPPPSPLERNPLE